MPVEPEFTWHVTCAHMHTKNRAKMRQAKKEKETRGEIRRLCPLNFPVAVSREAAREW